MTNKIETLTSKPRTLKEFANYYQVSPKTFKNWLDCKTLNGIKPESGYYYSIAQVKLIVDHLGSND